MTRTALTLIAALTAACADKIDPTPEPDAGVTPTGKVQTTRASDGTYTTVVDSSAMTGWTYADFETGMEADAAAPWDLRFQRFHISTNGGVTGGAGVVVAPITGTAFAAVTAAPTAGFTSDAVDGNGDMMPDYAFEQGDGWYDYDPGSHLLSPKSIVWVVKTSGGAMLKMEILRYYDTAGTSGWFTLHWGPL